MTDCWAIRPQQPVTVPRDGVGYGFGVGTNMVLTPSARPADEPVWPSGKVLDVKYARS